MLKLAVICTCFAVLCFAVAAAGEPSPPDGLLSVEETVKLASTIYLAPLRKEEAARRRRGNPAARPALYAIIEDPRKKLRWNHVISFFEHVGQTEDVVPLTRFIDGRRGLLETTETQTVSAVFRALAGMSARGIEEARATLDAMIRRRYWKDRPFRIRDDKGNPEALEFENDMVVCAVWGRVSAREDDFPQIARSVLQDVADRNQKRIMGAEIEAAIKSHAEYVREALDWGEPPAKQRRPLTGSVPTPTYQSPPAQEPGQAPALRQPGQPPRPSGSPRGQNAATSAEGVVDAALKAYERARAALATNNLPLAAQTLADNGKPMAADDNEATIAAVLADLRQTDEGLAQTRQVLADIEAAAFPLGPGAADITARTVLKETARGAGTYAQAYVEQVSIVRVPLEGSAELARKHFPNHPSNHITLDAKRQLVIYMIQKNGKWYWNPFGW